MRKTILNLVPALGLVLPLMARAQGTLYVSNLGQTPVGSAPIAGDAWIAQAFVTGGDSGGYALNAVQILMDAGSGSPAGFNASLYSSSSGLPASDLSALSGSDPAAGGIFTYAATGLTLSPSTGYFIVLTAATPSGQGAYLWSAANSFTESNQWQILDAYSSSPDGANWTLHIRSDVFQIGIYATAVPEPSVLALAGIGLACLGFWRRKQ